MAKFKGLTPEVGDSQGEPYGLSDGLCDAVSAVEILSFFFERLFPLFLERLFPLLEILELLLDLLIKYLPFSVLM